MNTKYFWLYGQARTTYCYKCSSIIPADYSHIDNVIDMCKTCDLKSLKGLCIVCAGGIMYAKHKLKGLL